MDRSYLSGLMDQVDRQRRSERMVLLHFPGPHLDRHNLIWLLRYRFKLRLSPSHTYFLLEARGQYLTHGVLAALVREESMDAVLARLPEPLQAHLPEHGSIGEIDRTLLRRELKAVSLFGTEPSLDDTREHMARLVETLAGLGESETALKRLLLEHRRIQTRVNALQHNIIPQYQRRWTSSLRWSMTSSRARGNHGGLTQTNDSPKKPGWLPPAHAGDVIL